MNTGKMLTIPPNTPNCFGDCEDCHINYCEVTSACLLYTMDPTINFPMSKAEMLAVMCNPNNRIPGTKK